MHWNTCTEEYVYPSNTTPEYGSILVPNVDNVRTDFLIKTIAKQGKAKLACYLPFILFFLGQWSGWGQFLGQELGKVTASYYLSLIMFLPVLVSQFTLI